MSGVFLASEPQVGYVCFMDNGLDAARNARGAYDLQSV